MARCKARNRTGDQCRNNAIPGTSCCYLSAHGGSKASFLLRAKNVIKTIGSSRCLYYWLFSASQFAAISGDAAARPASTCSPSTIGCGNGFQHSYGFIRNGNHHHRGGFNHPKRINPDSYAWHGPDRRNADSAKPPASYCLLQWRRKRD